MKIENQTLHFSYSLFISISLNFSRRREMRGGGGGVRRALPSLHEYPMFLLLLLLVATTFGQNGAVYGDVAEDTWRPEEVDAGGLSRKSFPTGFLFGTATSAYQVEGMASKEGRGPSIWDYFIQQKPGRVSNNATGDVAVDQYHRYKEDVDIMVKMNFDAYRFSISWSRIFPNGTGKVNEKGVAYYNRLIDYMLEKGITPYANLYHYDMPLALEKRYMGLLNRQVVKDYADYAEFCFRTFGDRVKNWMTFNEPRVTAALGYDNGIFAPGRCSKSYGNCTEGNSGTEPYIVAHNLILAHAEAVQRYREKYQAEQKGKIGTLLDFVWYEPLTRGKADNYAAQRARDFHIGWFLHPIVYGEYPKTMQEILGNRLPKFTKEEGKMVKGSFDYIGINQYTAYYMYDPHQKNQPKELGYQQDWNAGFACSNHTNFFPLQAHSYWLYNVPWGLYKCLMYVKERYGNPTVILSENGMDQPGNVTFPEVLRDTVRVNYYKGYLQQLQKAVDDGANVVGYFAWSLLDNFEWLSGYTSRFGIVYVDYGNLKRYPKMSAYWFQKMLDRSKQ
ncbi:Beta-glucosidase 44 [Linum perenne]